MWIFSPLQRFRWAKLTSIQTQLRIIWPYYLENRAGLRWGFALLVLSNATAAAIPYLLKLATNSLHHPSDPTRMIFFALGLMLLALFHSLLRIFGRIQVFRVGLKIEYELRKAYHAKLTNLDSSFFMQSRTGDLISRGINDILAVRMFIGPGFLQVTNTFMSYCIILPVMLTLDPLLTGLALLPFPIMFGLTWLMTKHLYQLSQIVADRFGKLSSFIQETLAGLTVLRALAVEPLWQHRFDQANGGLYEANLRHARLQSFFPAMILFGGALGVWIILAYSGPRVVEGTFTLGDFVAFTGYLSMLIWPTVGLGWILTILQRGIAALERIGVVLNASPMSPSAPSLAQPIRWSGNISIRHLHFSHATHPVLQGINIDIPSGAFIGLVGRIGSGKSTLLALLARLWPTPPGTIFFDQQDLAYIDEASLRHNLAMVPQDSFLFSASIQDNLLFGHPLAGEEKAWEMARFAALEKEILQFPQRMATIVGERGITLSGGQRQRVALARALVMETPILLFDDIFSSVDARTEATILQNLRQLTHGQTLLMVCHRIAALREADAIIVLDQGRIVAFGPHTQLLIESPLYQNLHDQMQRQEKLETLT
ncbi:MAG: ABC transporter ATP-binding protein/permease [Magnetococcus sp. DMHC-6]